MRDRAPRGSRGVVRAARSALRRFARGVLRVLTWPLRAWWRAFRRSRWFGRAALAALAAVVVTVAWLATAVPWPGYLFTPPFRAVQYGLPNDLQYLRPGRCAATADPACKPGEITWQGWTAEDRLRFYHHPQGSAQVMLAQMRYAWFVNLEQPASRAKFAEPENLARFGFLTDLRQQADPKWNPGNLPVGFAKYYDEVAGAELLDFTCSLCHTGELHHNGTAIRILGGQAMHAVTDMKPGQFQAGMLAAMLATYCNPWKFKRFAHAVIDPTLTGGTRDDFDFDAARRELRTAFGATMRRLLASAWTDLKHGNYPVFEGYGRTDATQRIANTVFGRHISPDNYRPATAPVSYPQLWDISKFNWVQWEGYASQPMARNVNESLGVGARLDLFDEYGAPLPPRLRYGTSIKPDRLHEIEQTVARLEAPAWPEHLFGAIDLPRARRGRTLFDVNCRHCHGPHLGPEPVPPGTYSRDPGIAVPLRYAGDGTCTLETPAGPLELDAQQCLNLQNPQRVTDGEGRRVYELDAAGRVVGLAPCEGTPGECARRPKSVTEWRVALLPLRDIGTDRNAALNFANNTYDASRLGWTVDELRELCLSEKALASIDPRRLNAVTGLNIMSLAIANRYFEEHRPASPGELMKFMGYGILDFPRTDPQRLQHYKSRPLHGIWATPPFLHNGSVRTIYQLISPREEREPRFWSGTKEYDPVDLGYRDLEVPGAVRFDTRVTGNDNIGHEFRDGCQKNGVIGRHLQPEERRQILEYLKLMDYAASDAPFPEGGVPYEPALCRDHEPGQRPQCFAGLRAEYERQRAQQPEWGTAAFAAGPWESHCSDDDAYYGDALPPPPEDDDAWNTWALSADGNCSVYGRLFGTEDPTRVR